MSVFARQVFTASVYLIYVWIHEVCHIFPFEDLWNLVVSVSWVRQVPLLCGKHSKVHLSTKVTGVLMT